MWRYNPTPLYELYHHGVKGQKWGERNGPPYPLKKTENSVEKTDKAGIIKSVRSGHNSNPKQSAPNSIMDHVTDDGKVDVRTFYGDTGWKKIELHTTNHGNPKQHPYGENGEHIETYEWNSDGTLKNLQRRNLTDEERKENEDIL